MSLEQSLTIVTIKWGSRYPMSLVNQLARKIRELSPSLKVTDFICFTDDGTGADDNVNIQPLPEIDLPAKWEWTFWRKISLYDPALGLTGPCIYLDLDVLITGDISPLLDNWQGEPRFVKSWVGKKTRKLARYDRVNSSVVLFTGSTCGEVYDLFQERQSSILEEYPGDQGFTYDCLAKRADFFPPEFCISFKKHCVPRFPFNLIRPPKPPPEAIVIIFHGHPDPAEAQRGYRHENIRKRSLPAPWIELAK